MDQGKVGTMRLTVVGSAGGYPTANTPSSGYLVEADGHTIWVDCGPGTYISLPVDPWEVDAFVISHRHVDHCADLLAVFHAFGYSPCPRESIPVYAAPGVNEAMVGFVELDDDHPFWSVFDFIEVGDGDTATVGPITLSFVPADHSVPDIATRFTVGDKSLVYTGDTGPGEWDEIATDADLFLCEASYQGEPGTHEYPFHLTAREAGEIAQRRGVGHLVLTHLSNRLDPSVSLQEAAEFFEGEISLAGQNDRYDV